MLSRKDAIHSFIISVILQIFHSKEKPGMHKIPGAVPPMLMPLISTDDRRPSDRAFQAAQCKKTEFHCIALPIENRAVSIGFMDWFASRNDAMNHF